ncbi:MAG: hypothetical protein GF329_06645 [Candidatus Lokiarchaeota archaeon]|nr:hypothetical protein [Candidatus Lokiarchaeota archaeon]
MQNKFDPELWKNLEKDIKRMRDQNLMGRTKSMKIIETDVIIDYLRNKTL